jgi:hypothetical protein
VPALAAPSQQSLLALSWLNFFLSGMQTAFGVSSQFIVQRIAVVGAITDQVSNLGPCSGTSFSSDFGGCRYRSRARAPPYRVRPRDATPALLTPLPLTSLHGLDERKGGGIARAHRRHAGRWTSNRASAEPQDGLRQHDAASSNAAWTLKRDKCNAGTERLCRLQIGQELKLRREQK